MGLIASGIIIFVLLGLLGHFREYLQERREIKENRPPWYYYWE